MLDLVTPVSEMPSGLFGKTREALLSLLILRADERFHLRQISRLTGVGLGPVQRELAALVAMGLLARERSGHQVYFQARVDAPIFNELKNLLLKTSGAAGVLRALLAPFRPEIMAAAVFGSVAAGKSHLQSDVDVLIISASLTIRQLAATIRQGSSALSRDVNINLYRPEEWRQRVGEGHPLARSILQHPVVMLIGDCNDLGRLA